MPPSERAPNVRLTRTDLAVAAVVVAQDSDSSDRARRIADIAAEAVLRPYLHEHPPE